jgi:hypothetical protein
MKKPGRSKLTFGWPRRSTTFSWHPEPHPNQEAQDAETLPGGYPPERQSRFFAWKKTKFILSENNLQATAV